MTLYKNTFRIESARLEGYNYSQPGEYFVTICIQNHKCLFGQVIDSEMRLNNAGEIAKQCWEEIPRHFVNVVLDEFVVMPNHVHGIIILNEIENEVLSNEMIIHSHGRDVQLNVSTKISPKRGSLSVIIRTYKAAVTLACRNNGCDGFHWQPRFHDHIVRGEKDLENIRDYIINNPLNWWFDDENLDKEL